MYCSTSGAIQYRHPYDVYLPVGAVQLVQRSILLGGCPVRWPNRLRRAVAMPERDGHCGSHYKSGFVHAGHPHGLHHGQQCHVCLLRLAVVLDQRGVLHSGGAIDQRSLYRGACDQVPDLHRDTQHHQCFVVHGNFHTAHQHHRLHNDVRLRQLDLMDQRLGVHSLAPIYQFSLHRGDGSRMPDHYRYGRTLDHGNRHLYHVRHNGLPVLGLDWLDHSR